MQSSRTFNHPKKNVTPRKLSSNYFPSAQHGSRLLHPDFPPDTLNWTTSYCDPDDLFALSLASKHLHAHVALDSTWRTAYARHFLGINPEVTLTSNVALLLRRSESTWKKEYVKRFYAIWRWKESHTPYVMHTPHHSQGSNLCYLPDHEGSKPGLLSASLKYGIVARSLPANGKVLKGYLEASRIFNGHGNGNPNAAFSPDVTAIDTSFIGRTAFIAWGFRNGDLGLTIALKAMVEGTKNTDRRHWRCAVAESHESRVESIIFSSDASSLVSGGFDGRVKVWSTKPLQLLWTYSPPSGVIPDPVQRVAYESESGTVAAVARTGSVLLWTRLNMPLDSAMTQQPRSDVPIHILSPQAKSDLQNPTATTLRLHCTSGSIELLIQRSDLPFLERVSIDTASFDDNTGTPHLSMSRTRYIDGPLTRITVAKANFARSAPATPIRKDPNGPADTPLSAIAQASLNLEISESSFLVSGDDLGRVHIWPWNRTSGDESEVRSWKGFQAHPEGAVTAIEISHLVMVTGSSKGDVAVWDALTLAPLRSISISSSKPSQGMSLAQVEEIIVDATADVLIVAVGSQVLFWRATKPPAPSKNQKERIRGQAAVRPADARYLQQLEVKRQIRESRTVMEDERRDLIESQKRSAARKATFNIGGLNEAEALEYALMLSRDEAEARTTSVEPSSSASSTASNFASPAARHNILVTARSPKSKSSKPTDIHTGSHREVSPRLAPSSPSNHIPTTQPPSVLVQAAASSRTPLLDNRIESSPERLDDENEDEEMKYALAISLADARSRGSLE